MHFLIDAQLPPNLARWLEEHGHRATHAAQIGLAAAADPVLWQRAQDLRAVLITKDEDFVALRSRSAEGAAVVWLRLGNATNRVLIPWFAERFASIEHALTAGETLIEVR